MGYTVKELAQLSGVSVRTLHFYDEAGLLKPAYVKENGYRFYEEEQLLQLQQILFFRELDFELKQIQKIVSQSDFNKIAALCSHREILKKRGERIQTLIETIDKTIRHLKKEKTMSDQEIYDGFSKEKQEEYEKYILDRYGKKAESLIEESKRNIKGFTQKDYDQIKQEFDSVHRELSKAIDERLSTGSQEVQSLIQRHFQIISRFYNPTKEVYAGLADLYLEHPDFRKMYETFHPQMVTFLAEAMKLYAQRNL